MNLQPGTVLRNALTGTEVTLAEAEADDRLGGWWTTSGDYLSATAIDESWRPADETVDGQRGSSDRILAAFLAFHHDHPEVLTEIIRLTEQARDAGRTRTSMKAIFEVLRWTRHVTRDADPYKLNNNYTALYSRLVAETRPDLADMFEIRNSPSRAA